MNALKELVFKGSGKIFPIGAGCYLKEALSGIPPKLGLMG